MRYAIRNGLANCFVKRHAALLILVDVIDEETVIHERPTAFQDTAMFFVRDVDDMADELEICPFFFERRRKFQHVLVSFHIIADIEHVKMRRGYPHELRAILCFAVHEVREHDKCTIDQQSVGHVRINAALVLDEDDGLIFPEEREVVLLLVEEHVVERRDGNVLRTNIVCGANRLIECGNLALVVEKRSKDGILVLAVRHASHPLLCSYFSGNCRFPQLLCKKRFTPERLP